MKRILFSFLVMSIVAFVSLSAISCSDDDDLPPHKYPFVGNVYSHSITNVSTGFTYRLDIEFLTDSTFTITSKKETNGENYNAPYEGSYTYDNGQIEFNIREYHTYANNNKIQLLRAQFVDDDYLKLMVDLNVRTSGNPRFYEWELDRIK